MLTEQQAEIVKKQLLKQLDNFPEDKRGLVENKILSMSTEEIESFLKENQLAHMQQPSESQNPQQNGCIFCNISSKKIPSFALDEDKENLAVLELTPLSKGHSIVIPKKHLDTTQIPASTLKIAKKIAKKIEDKLKPKEVKISVEKIIGHTLIEVIPIYGNETERKKANEKELKELQEILKKEKKSKQIKKETKKKEDLITKIPILKPRIP